MSYKLPNVPHPCDQCPFRKDTTKGWLGAERMSGIIDSPSFTCHKTSEPKRLQCAGHMLLLENKNIFHATAKSGGIPMSLSGRELVFDTEEDCITHHSNP